MNEILIALAGLITVGGSGFFGWFFARRKFTAEATTVEVGNKALEIDNEIKLSNYHKEMLDDLKPRYEMDFQNMKIKYETEFKNYQDTVTAKEKLLLEEITLLRRENKLLKRQVAEKDREIKERDKRIAELERTK